MHVTKPCQFAEFGAMHVTKPCKFAGGREGGRRDRQLQGKGGRQDSETQQREGGEEGRDMGMDGVAYAGGFAYAVWEA